MNASPVVSESELPPQSTLQANFLGIMRGEFLKIARLFWGMLALLTLGFFIAFLLGASARGARGLQDAPLAFLYNALESNLVIVRILGGIFLLVLTSFVIGREYQYGTIRILLARGTGRVQLLLAKIAVLILVALALLVIFSLFIVLLVCLQMLILVGNLSGLSALTSTFWLGIGIDLLAVLISMGATILLATAMNALGRSLTLGLSASLIWFPLDNIGPLIMNALTHLTHSDFWNNATTYFLGPLLNRLPTILMPAETRSGFESFGSGAASPVSAPHALWVIGAYALICLLLALISTWKRDVRE